MKRERFDKITDESSGPRTTASADIMFILLFVQVNWTLLKMRKTHPKLHRTFEVPDGHRGRAKPRALLPSDAVVPRAPTEPPRRPPEVTIG